MQAYLEEENEVVMKCDEDFLIYTPNQPIGYYNIKLYDIIENIFKVKPSELTNKIPEELIDRIILSTGSNERYNIAVTDEGVHYFMGYPNSNFLCQLTAILTLWHERSIFPVTFLAMPEMEDNTGCEIERLNLLTQDVREIFKQLSTCSVIDIYK